MIMNEKKIYKVQIFEEHYVLLSDEPESFVMKSAEMVDAIMKEVSHLSAVTDPRKIAVLTAVRIAHQLLKKEQDYDEGQEQRTALEKYIDQELSILSL